MLEPSEVAEQGKALRHSDIRGRGRRFVKCSGNEPWYGYCTRGYFFKDLSHGGLRPIPLCLPDYSSLQLEYILTHVSLLHASITVWNHGMATVPLSEMGTLFAISSPPRTSSSSKRFRFRNIYFRISRLFYSRFSLRVFRPVAAVASSPARSHGTAELNDNKPKRITRVTLVNY